MHLNRFFLPLLLTLLLTASTAHAGTADITFERSLHEGTVAAAGELVGLEYLNLNSASASLTFESASYEQGWANRSIDAGNVGQSYNTGMHYDDFDAQTIQLFATQTDAILMLFQDGPVQWTQGAATQGTAAKPSSSSVLAGVLEDQTPVNRDHGDFTVNVEDTTAWTTERTAQDSIQGDFRLSLFGWTLQFEDESSIRTGTTTTANAPGVAVEDLTVGWLHLKNATLTIQSLDGLTRTAYTRAPTIITDGLTTFEGLLGSETTQVEGVTTVTVLHAGDHLQATLTEGPPTPTTPSTNAITTPEGSWWLWGGVGGATLLVTAFVVLFLMTRNVPMLEWRAYHALDEHRPRTAVFWASFWTRKDPWEGHAWSARGEARLLMGSDRRAARDFTRAHTLLPVEERAVNALHAARAHARLGRASQTAHWIGIVANLDVNVLLSAREEPDFARVWNEPAVQRTVQQVLGVGV